MTCSSGTEVNVKTIPVPGTELSAKFLLLQMHPKRLLPRLLKRCLKAMALEILLFTFMLTVSKEPLPSKRVCILFFLCWKLAY